MVDEILEDREPFIAPLGALELRHHADAFRIISVFKDNVVAGIASVLDFSDGFAIAPDGKINTRAGTDRSPCFLASDVFAVSYKQIEMLVAT